MVSDSQFAMWRSAVGFTYADHTLTDEERVFLHRFIKKQDFSEEQRTQLEKDIDNGVDVNEVITHITEQRDRAHLLNIGRALFFADDTFCENEQALYDKLHASHMASLDLETIFRDAEQEAKLMREEFAAREQLKRDDMGPIERLADYIGNVFSS